MKLNFADCLVSLGRAQEAIGLLDTVLEGEPCYIPARPYEVERNCVAALKSWERYPKRYQTLLDQPQECAMLREQIDKLALDEECRRGIGQAFADAPCRDWFAVLCMLRGNCNTADSDLERVLIEAPAEPECAELLYFAMKRSLDIAPFVSRVDSDDLTVFLRHLETKPDIGHQISEYAKFQELGDMRCVRWKIAIMEHILLSADPRYWVSMRNFKIYCAALAYYVTNLYGETVSEDLFSVIPHAHRFGLYMREANAAMKKGNPAVYLRFLTKAGEAYPYMISFIQYLIGEVQSNLEKESSAADESALLLSQLKEKIQDMIFAGDLENAGNTLDAFEKIRPDDEDIEWLRMQLQPSAGELS